MQSRTLLHAQPLWRFKLIDYKRHLSTLAHPIKHGRHEAVRSVPITPMAGFQSRSNSVIRRVSSLDPIPDRNTAIHDFQKAKQLESQLSGDDNVPGRTSSSTDGSASDDRNQSNPSNAVGEDVQHFGPTITRVEFQPPFTYVPSTTPSIKQLAPQEELGTCKRICKVTDEECRIQTSVVDVHGRCILQLHFTLLRLGIATDRVCNIT